MCLSCLFVGVCVLICVFVCVSVGLALGGSSEVLAFDQGLADLTNEALSPTYQVRRSLDTTPGHRTSPRSERPAGSNLGHMGAAESLLLGPLHQKKCNHLHATTSNY